MKAQFCDNRYLRPKPGGHIQTMAFWNGSPCILWPGCNANGYGTVWIDGRRMKAHRAVYENHNGKIPDGLVIDHLCRNQYCVNPDHLEAVDIKTNVLRGFGPPAQNASKGYCCNGHPLTGQNLKLQRSESGTRRRCRVCLKATKHRTYEKSKAARLVK